MNKLAAQPDLLMAWMTSLSDPTRLRLLRLLEGHELGVVELCEVLQLPQSTVSRHLKVLADQGWVRSSRQGTAHLYRMTLDELEPGGRRLWLLAREQTQDWPTVQQDELRLSRRLRERQAHAQAFFAGAAGQWDKLRRELYGERFTLDAILALLPEEWVVADLGCGTAPITAELARHVAKVIAVDSSAAMLKAAQKRVAELPNVEIRRGDLRAAPIEDGTCDAALLLIVLSYLAEPAAAVREAWRILRPAGRLVLVDLLPHDREDFRRQMEQQWTGFGRGEIEKMLTEAGFGAVRIQPLAPEAAAKGPALFLSTARKPVGA